MRLSVSGALAEVQGQAPGGLAGGAQPAGGPGGGRVRRHRGLCVGTPDAPLRQVAECGSQSCGGYRGPAADGMQLRSDSHRCSELDPPLQSSDSGAQGIRVLDDIHA